MWLSSATDTFKSILTVSGIGISALLLILKSSGVNSNFEKWLYGTALVAFIISMVLVVWSFHRTAEYFERIATEGDIGVDEFLKKLYYLVLILFTTGMMASVAIGGVYLTNEQQERDSNMRRDQPKDENTQRTMFNFGKPQTPNKPETPSSKPIDPQNNPPQNQSGNGQGGNKEK